MDISTIFGLVVAFGSLCIAVGMEGGTLGSLVNPSAALIVFGGSLGAAMVGLPLASVIKAPMVLKNAVFTRVLDPQKTIELLSGLARVARKEGVLALEGELVNIDDPFIRRGVQLLVDGTDPEVTEAILGTEIDALVERHDVTGKLFNTMGGLAPTLGVTGTVMGLVHMLGQLDDPGAMGPAIAAAFIATLYGVASANLLFLPLGAKLKLRSQQEAAAREMVVIGIGSLQAGESPMILTERLNAFLSPKARAQAEAGGGAEGGEAGEPVGAEA